MGSFEIYTGCRPKYPTFLIVSCHGNFFIGMTLTAIPIVLSLQSNAKKRVFEFYVDATANQSVQLDVIHDVETLYSVKTARSE